MAMQTEYWCEMRRINTLWGLTRFALMRGCKTWDHQAGRTQAEGDSVCMDVCMHECVVADIVSSKTFQGVQREKVCRKSFRRIPRKEVPGHLMRSPESQWHGKLDHIYCIYIWCMIILIGYSWFSSFFTSLQSSHLFNSIKHWFLKAGSLCHRLQPSVCITELIN